MGAKRSVLTLHKKIAKRDREDLARARAKGQFHKGLSITEKLAGAYVKATRR